MDYYEKYIAVMDKENECIQGLANQQNRVLVLIEKLLDLLKKELDESNAEKIRLINNYFVCLDYIKGESYKAIREDGEDSFTPSYDIVSSMLIYYDASPSSTPKQAIKDIFYINEIEPYVRDKELFAHIIKAFEKIYAFVIAEKNNEYEIAVKNINKQFKLSHYANATIKSINLLQDTSSLFSDFWNYIDADNYQFYNFKITSNSYLGYSEHKRNGMLLAYFYEELMELWVKYKKIYLDSISKRIDQLESSVLEDIFQYL